MKITPSRALSALIAIFLTLPVFAGFGSLTGLGGKVETANATGVVKAFSQESITIESMQDKSLTEMSFAIGMLTQIKDEAGNKIKELTAGTPVNITYTKGKTNTAQLILIKSGKEPR